MSFVSLAYKNLWFRKHRNKERGGKMRALYEPLGQEPELKKVKEGLKKDKVPVLLTGCTENQKCHVMKYIGEEYLYRVIITYDESRGKQLQEEYHFFDKNVHFYPSKDVLFYSADVHGNEIVKQRQNVIKGLLDKQPLTVVVTLDGLLDKVVPLSEIESQVLRFQVGQQIVLEELKEKLIHLGYERASFVEGTGQFAIRGGIIDIFPLTEDCPYRIELWDDEVDSIRSFDVQSQRSIESVEELAFYPACEMVLDKKRIEKGIERIEEEFRAVYEKLRGEFKTEESHRLKKMVEKVKEDLTEFNAAMGLDSFLPYFYEKTVSLLDYFPKGETVFFLDEPNRIQESAYACQLEFRESMTQRLEGGYILPKQAEVLHDYKEILAKISNEKTVLLSMLAHNLELFDPKEFCELRVKSVAPYLNSFSELLKDIKKYKSEKYKILLFCASKTRALRLVDDLRNDEVECAFTEDMEKNILPGELVVAAGRLKKGFEYPSLKFVVISESDIFSNKPGRKVRKRAAQSGEKISSFHDLSVGDYVVHENHGLGIYKGIEKIQVDGIQKDYISIEYEGGSKLFIQTSSLDLIQKYAGKEARKPKLNKLGGTEWKKTKDKVRTQVESIAKDLVELYAVRQERTGYQFVEDTVWQREFEEMFPYEETQDQLRAIEETKQDMMSTKIMDRLICGDVGFGKTEVAIRAAFKAVDSGKQVAYLVPTTILAQQHYETFFERMKEFPIRVGVLSRFRTPYQQKKTIEAIKTGQVDIVIGTHRLLSKDVQFKNLGLLIIDEEQRFGVTHKEKIKMLKKDVDVLTLSATPIPRTLHMSLIGIRDMSLLEEAPVDRQGIQTYVLEYNAQLIKEAIHRELARGGQVYYVYNRVNNIDEVALELSKLVPDARVAFAHGQMSERELEKIMFAFTHKELDVLVATTIIETGLDIPNVNTMIIHDANKLGLSQLYQLRGRVGRSNRQAYAFLMYKRDTMLKETAEKRLQAIREFTDLGSGVKIAMRDLEIRGAGNLLGEDQSGHMAAVGYDLYCKMLNEAVLNLKGEEVEENFETVIDLPIDAFIPATYVKNEATKLELYKRIAEISNSEEQEDMLDELTDRFSDPPAPVVDLLKVALLKAKAHKIGILEVALKSQDLEFKMKWDAKIDAGKIPAFIESYPRTMRLKQGKEPTFSYFAGRVAKKELLDTIDNILERMKEEICL